MKCKSNSDLGSPPAGAEIEVTPAMIVAGAKILEGRWVDLVSISENELFEKVSAEMLLAVYRSRQESNSVD